MPAYTAHTKSSNIGRTYHWFQLCIGAIITRYKTEIPVFPHLLSNDPDRIPQWIIGRFSHWCKYSLLNYKTKIQLFFVWMQTDEELGVGTAWVDSPLKLCSYLSGGSSGPVRRGAPPALFLISRFNIIGICDNFWVLNFNSFYFYPSNKAAKPLSTIECP